MNEQEIKAKSLELTIQLVSLLPEKKKIEQFEQGDLTQVIIELSRDFQDYLKKPS
jgi:hypothetical protein